MRKVTFAREYHEPRPDAYTKTLRDDFLFILHVHKMKKCPCVSVSLWTAWEISTEMYYFYPPFESHRARLTASSVSCANAFKRSKIMRLFIHTNTRVAQMVICFDGMHLVVVESITLWPLIHSARLNIDCWLDMFMMLLKCSGNFRFFFSVDETLHKITSFEHVFRQTSTNKLMRLCFSAH